MGKTCRLLVINVGLLKMISLASIDCGLFLSDKTKTAKTRPTHVYWVPRLRTTMNGASLRSMSRPIYTGVRDRESACILGAKVESNSKDDASFRPMSRSIYKGIRESASILGAMVESNSA